MPTYQLPSKGTPTPQTLRRIDKFFDGLTLGPGGYQVRSDGSVTVDATTDPGAAWAAFNPGTPSSQEATLAGARTKLAAGTPLTPQETSAVLLHLLDRVGV